MRSALLVRIFLVFSMAVFLLAGSAAWARSYSSYGGGGAGGRHGAFGSASGGGTSFGGGSHSAYSHSGSAFGASSTPFAGFTPIFSPSAFSRRQSAFSSAAAGRRTPFDNGGSGFHSSFLGTSRSAASTKDQGRKQNLMKDQATGKSTIKNMDFSNDASSFSNL